MSKVEIKEPEYHLFPYVEKTALVVAITVCALSAIASVIGYSNNSPLVSVHHVCHRVCRCCLHS